MSKYSRAAVVAASIVLAVTGGAVAQQPQSPNMTFFITSVGSPFGADFGGIEGADRHCRVLALSLIHI
jgi:hypothetical protein